MFAYLFKTCTGLEWIVSIIALLQIKMHLTCRTSTLKQWWGLIYNNKYYISYEYFVIDMS